jgi:hypothetical protein
LEKVEMLELRAGGDGVRGAPGGTMRRGGRGKVADDPQERVGEGVVFMGEKIV